MTHYCHDGSACQNNARIAELEVERDAHFNNANNAWKAWHEAGRAAGIEEAAAVCDDGAMRFGVDYAAKIRALKTEAGR